jgi:hypothetical protein
MADVLHGGGTGRTPLDCDGTAATPSVRLSKSKLTTYLQCPKRLWLQVHRPGVGIVDPCTLRLFEAGHRIGELARLQVPNGILIDPNPKHLVAALLETSEAMSVGRPLFEPAFVHQGVVVRVDILEPQPGGTWRLIEVKNSSAVRPYQLDDVASQAWVLAGNGVKLASLSIRLPTDVLRPSARDWRARMFADVDVSCAVTNHLKYVPQTVAGARETVEGREPERAIGPHCRRPFRCEFVQYCSQQGMTRAREHDRPISE